MRNTNSVFGNRKLLVSMIGVGLAAMAVGPVAAQASKTGGQTQEPVEKTNPVELDSVVVTATRREQLLQDVPVAVTAVSGKTLERSNFREVSDIQYLAPNVTFSATNPVSNGGGYQIRGVGTQTFDSGVEQTVGLVVDGVVIGLSRDPGATGFSDIDRVEVLRGPQGTLFGKNSSAGVIQIVTKQPKIGENSGDLSLSYGERNEEIARGNVNLGGGEDAALRLSAYYQAQDGAIPQVAREDGSHVGDRENKGVRAKVLWWATDNLSLLFSAEHQQGFARDAHTIETLSASPLYRAQFAGFDELPGHGVYKAFQDGDWTAETKIDAASLQLDYLLGDHTLTAISAYRKLETEQLADIDGSPADIFNHSDGGVDSSQLTHELRLTSPSGERLEYVLGTYYYRTDTSGWATQVGKLYGLLPFGLPGVLGGGRRDQTGDNRSLAAYGQATYGLTDTFKLIGGLRYTKDKVWGTAGLTPLPYPAIPIGVFQPYDGKFVEENVSGRVGLQYEPTDNLMLYATYARGYKGPAIDGTTGVPHEVKPETVDSYEAGVRSTLWGGRMILNATLYSSDFKDFQAQTLDLSSTPPRFALSNAGLMRARGVELESTFRLAEHFDLSFAATYSDAKFKEFLGQCYSGQPISPTPGVGCYIDPVSGQPVANYAGERLSNAPEWTYIVRGAYEHPFGNGLKFDASANWSWRSEAQAVVGDPKAVIDAYGLLNANVGFGKQDGSWRIGLYARNLLDEQFYAPYASGTTALTPNPGGYFRIMSPDAFRTVGVNLSLKF